VVDSGRAAVAPGSPPPPEQGYEVAYEVHVDRPDPERGPEHDGEYGDYGDYDAAQDVTMASPMSGRPRRPPLGRAQLRADFGAHFEAHYQRLVAQLFAITLNSGEAHEVVQDAYSRAWRQWVTISRLRDPAEWIRRVAVRSTIRSWRRTLVRLGIGRPQPVSDDSVEPRTAALLSALARLSPAERRAIVLHHMAGWPISEIAVVERSSPGSVSVRLARATQVVGRALPDLLERPIDPYDEPYQGEHDPYEGEEQYR
jgi:RNA polymerase sigma factor (sigma-70 family)